jgi:hypothetical protein
MSNSSKIITHQDAPVTRRAHSPPNEITQAAYKTKQKIAMSIRSFVMCTYRVISQGIYERDNGRNEKDEILCQVFAREMHHDEKNGEGKGEGRKKEKEDIEKRETGASSEFFFLGLFSNPAATMIGTHSADKSAFAFRAFIFFQYSCFDPLPCSPSLAGLYSRSVQSKRTRQLRSSNVKILDSTKVEHCQGVVDHQYQQCIKGDQGNQRFIGVTDRRALDFTVTLT